MTDNRLPPIVDASCGFTSALWRVQTADGVVHFVQACNNYDACEAVGSRFSACQVDEMSVVQRVRG